MKKNQTWTDIVIDRTATKIVSNLFRNGQGEKADRLMLILKDGSDGGGWCRAAVHDKITKILKEGLE